MWVTLLWENRRLIAEITCIIVFLGAFWWGFIHNPKIIKEQARQIQIKDGQIEAGKKLLDLYNDIQKGKERIDEATAQKVLNLRNMVFKPHSSYVFMPGGRL